MKHLIRSGVTVLFLLYPFIVGYSLAHGHFIWVSALLVLLGGSRLFFKKSDLFKYQSTQCKNTAISLARWAKEEIENERKKKK